MASALSFSRKQINIPGFDPSSYLSKQVTNVSMDGTEPERNLYELFDNLFNHLDELAQEIEGEVQELQHAAFNMENSLFKELDVQSDRLNELNKSVDFVKASFEHASEGAVRVGGRLGVSDKVRANISYIFLNALTWLMCTHIWSQ